MALDLLHCAAQRILSSISFFEPPIFVSLELRGVCSLFRRGYKSEKEPEQTFVQLFSFSDVYDTSQICPVLKTRNKGSSMFLEKKWGLRLEDPTILAIAHNNPRHSAFSVRRILSAV